MTDSHFEFKAGTPTPTPSNDNWVLRIESVTNDSVGIGYAIGFGQSLVTGNTQTPFHYRFQAASYTVMVSTLNGRDRIRAELENVSSGHTLGNKAAFGLAGGTTAGMFSSWPELNASRSQEGF